MSTTYDRAARRLADNRHGNTPSGDYNLDESDDVARATYPDPKARALYGESAVLAQKRGIRAGGDKANDREPVAPVKAAKK